MILTFFGLLLILYKTLYPFDFCFTETYRSLGFHFPILGWGKFNMLDIQGNLLLFIPLSFGLTGYLMQTRRLSKPHSFSVIILMSFWLSYTIEVLQVFQQSRFPSLVDVFSNSIGGLLGFLCFCLWERRIKISDHTSAFVGNNLCLSFFGYAIFVLVISTLFQWYTSLSNWDKAFHLLLGNERTGDHPWEGYISGLYIIDRAISETEVANVFSETDSIALNKDSFLASYQLIGLGSYHDNNEFLPDLVWKGKLHDVQQGGCVFLSHNNWLETIIPAESLTQRIVETSQFTLGISLATSDIKQTGPARIVSLSGGSSSRNFTLGQKNSDLIFRLRTPLTGENGNNPELVVPDVFSTLKSHDLVITYDGSVLHLYVDGVLNPEKLELAPGRIPLSYSFQQDTYHLVCYKIIYYAIVFIPLGILLSIAVNTIKGRMVVKMLTICGSILLSSFIIEVILMCMRGRDLGLGNLLISMIFTAGSLNCFFKLLSWKLN